MHQRLAVISLLFMATVTAKSALADGVTTYGTGLKSCEAYLAARDQQSSEEVAFVDWFSGYLSGVNSAYNRANNILADANLKQSMYWVESYCRAHTTDSFAVASFALLRRASAATRTQDFKTITYGAGFKSCGTYLTARETRDPDEMEFVDWLGGYLSGVNAISLDTTNVLGTSDLAGTISWLDNYCRERAAARFAAAAEARVAGFIAAVAVQKLPPPPPRR
jgi:hypothetical protein